VISKTYTSQVHLLKSSIVTVEVDLSKGLHSFSIVGLASKSVDEAKDRVSSAIKNTGFRSPKNKNQKIADIGAGSGYYVTEIAKALMSSGTVYAIDINKELLEKIKNKTKHENLSNVEVIWGDFELENGTKLKTSSIDMVFACNVFFFDFSKLCPLFFCDFLLFDASF
jgi:SAM-dependent methyltransferase